MAKKSEEKVAKLHAMKNDAESNSCLHDSLKFFPCFPLKTVVVKQNLLQLASGQSPPSLPRFLAFLKKATTFLPTLALDHWLLSSKQLNLSSVTTILHYSLFMIQKLFYIIYNKRKLLCLIFPFVISPEFMKISSCFPN